MIKHSSLILVMILLSIIDSSANIRAPKNINYPPSSALYQGTQDATVLREVMDVTCDNQVCEVIVKYTLYVNKKFSAIVDFMLPGEVDVSVKIGDNIPIVKIKPIPYGKDSREKDARTAAFSGILGQLYRASFPLSLGFGQHEVLIKYSQPLSQKEVDYSYFSKGYFFGVFQYEIWPIKEWEIASDFNLKLIVKLKTESLNWWEKLVDNHSVNCAITTFTPCEDTGGYKPEICHTTKKVESSAMLDALVVKKHMQLPLPDRLSCEIGKKE